MSYYFRTLAAEFLKLRRTLAFWCVLIAPTLLVVLTYAMLFGRSTSVYPPDFNAWDSTVSNGFNLWGLLVLPLYIALQTTLLAQLEHGSQQWKHLYALPVPRFAYFAAKWSVVVIVVLVTHLLLALELAGAGHGLGLFTHQWGLDGPIPWSSLELAIATLSGGALLVLTFHLLVSVVAFLIPSLGVGVMAALSNVFLLSSDKYYIYNPWLYPVLAYHGEGNDPQLTLLLGLGGGLLLALIGGWAFVRKQIS